MKVRDKEGKIHEKDPVDVRECVSILGWTEVGADEAHESEREEQSNDNMLVSSANLNATELRGLLDLLNVPYKSNTKVAELRALIDESRPLEGDD